MHFEKISHQGPPLVLLHGWGQNLESLRPVAQLLAPNYQVYLFDLPGFGKSPAPTSTWDSFQYADALRNQLQVLGVDTFSIVGHSFGGKVAMSLAVRYPDKVQNLVLLAPSGLKKKRSWLELSRFYAIRLLGKATKKWDTLFRTSLFESYFIPRFGSKDYKNAKEMRAILVKSVNEDFTPHLKQIEAKTLILWGEKDQETPVEIAMRLHKEIAASTLAIFPHKDHYLYNDLGSHLVAFYIRNFLRAHHG